NKKSELKGVEKKRKNDITITDKNVRERMSDMNKKLMVVIISLLLLVVLIGVGGKMYMDKRAKQKEDEKIEIERKSVEALKERYANIKTVEIEKTAYNKMTGAYSLYVKMTNDKSES